MVGASHIPRDWFRVASYEHEPGTRRFNKGDALFSRKASALPLKGFVHLFRQKKIAPTEQAPTSIVPRSSTTAECSSVSPQISLDPHYHLCGNIPISTEYGRMNSSMKNDPNISSGSPALFFTATSLSVLMLLIGVAFGILHYCRNKNSYNLH